MSNTKYSLRTITEQDYDFIYQVKKDAYIITFQGMDIGFYNESQTGSIYEIGNSCILPEYQNRGIGTAILQDVIEKHGHKEIHLQYFKQNPVGRLYERLGFEQCGETTYHYQMKK